MEKPDGSTGIRKRQQIVTANKTVFAWIIAASIIVGICGVVSQFLIRQMIFNNKILTTLNTTNANITKSITAYDDLKREVTKLVADTNLQALKKTAASTALQVVIDALPTEENRVAFATSLQNEILIPSGATIGSFTVVDQNSATTQPKSANVDAGVQSFSFSFTISGTYTQVQQAIRNMERSIRPISIQSFDIQGTDANMKANITAVTYYQSAKNVQLKDDKVKP